MKDSRAGQVSAQNIKSMKLYWHVGRIYNELKFAGIDQNPRLDVSDLSPFDQYHYHGTDAVDAAIERMGIDHTSRVVDVGAGIGGPARYIAEQTGCKVSALELQAELNELGKELTARCGLSRRVEHIAGDVLEIPLAPAKFDAIVSWLAFYHIADHRKLLSKLLGALRDRGRLYIEDLCIRAALTPAEQALLSEELYSRRLLTIDQYRQQLNEAGFAEIEIHDMSDDWTQFTHERLMAFGQDRERHVRVQGEEIVAALEAFYTVVDRLFQARNLGGLRITAQKIQSH